jgi:hypothetical protein
VTVYQRSARCWVIDPPPTGEDYAPHRDGRAEVMAAIKQGRRDDRGVAADAKPKQCNAPCWLIQCDGCEEHIDEQGECYIAHCESRQAAEELMASYQWAFGGDLAYCPDDQPEDAEVPPPSPAQLEAAGQLRLPGVLP